MLGERIKTKRESLGMTLKELAEKIGVTEATMSRYETNQIKNPSHGKLKDLASALSVDINYLMDWEGNDEFTSEEMGSLTEDERELIAIFRRLDRRKKHEMMSEAYRFERRGSRD